MSEHKLIKFNLNRFFKEIHFKKQYFKKMQNNVYLLNKLKETNQKTVGSHFSSKLTHLPVAPFVMYIVEVSFSKKNTLFHIMDHSGNIKYFFSAGSFQQSGKGKIARSTVLRKFYRLLITKLKFVRKVPIAIHFRNADSNLLWFLKKLKKKFFVTVVKHFNQYPYNGCRKKKIRRKKFKSGSLVI